MALDKKALLCVVQHSDLDQALQPLYEAYGPAVRSEYTLDGEAIVDLDWETSGMVVTLNEGKIEQVRLLVNTPQKEQVFDGWIGDRVTSDMNPEQLHSILNLSDNLDFEDSCCRLRFEFDHELLEYVVLTKL